MNALSGEVTETSDYFPFGMRMDIWGAVEDESNRYRFNGKEEQEGDSEYRLWTTEHAGIQRMPMAPMSYWL